MWIYKNKELKEIPHNSTHFVYLITNIQSGLIYIGYKGFYSKKTKKLGKKAIAALPDKRMSKKIKTVEESNWKVYNSSNKYLADLITKNSNSFKKEILYFTNTEVKARYLEAKEIFCRGLLENNSYNGNVRFKHIGKIKL